MNLLLSNPELIYGCSYLIELILGNYLRYDLSKFKDNIYNIQNCDLINLLNNYCDKNKILEEVLINCFEFHINLYFKEIAPEDTYPVFREMAKRKLPVHYMTEREDIYNENRTFNGPDASSCWRIRNYAHL